MRDRVHSRRGGRLTAAVFVALTGACALGLGLAIGDLRPRATALASGVIAAWLAVTATLAASGVLDPPAPPGAFPVVLPALAAAVGIAVSPLGARLARLPLPWLVGFQAFRIGVELVLWRLHHQGLIPVHMTFEGANFDVLTGVGAALLALAIPRLRSPAVYVHLWNVAGLLLLATIVAIAIRAVPGPGWAWPDAEPNLVPSTFPYVWLPAFLVPLALLGHLLVFRRLRQDRAAA